MGLIPKIVLSDLSQDATSFKFLNITGDYDVSGNIGGYGGPNILKASITKIILSLYNEGADATAIKYVAAVSADFLEDTDSIEVPSTLFNLVQYTDGVMNLDIHVFTGPKVVTVSSDGLAIESVGLFIGDEDLVNVGANIYKVDKSRTNTTNKLYLLSNIPPLTVSAYVGYIGKGRIINKVTLESNLAKEIGSWAGKPYCSCASMERLLKILLKNIGADVRFDSCDYAGAQKIIGNTTFMLEGNCKC